MSWILVCGAVVCGWAMLRTMGAERERCVMEQRAAVPPTAPPAPPPVAAATAAPAPKASPLRAKATRPRQAA